MAEPTSPLCPAMYILLSLLSVILQFLSLNIQPNLNEYALLRFRKLPLLCHYLPLYLQALRNLFYWDSILILFLLSLGRPINLQRR